MASVNTVAIGSSIAAEAHERIGETIAYLRDHLASPRGDSGAPIGELTMMQEAALIAAFGRQFDGFADVWSDVLAREMPQGA
jgi:hypothetical protein